MLTFFLVFEKIVYILYCFCSFTKFCVYIVNIWHFECRSCGSKLSHWVHCCYVFLSVRKWLCGRLMDLVVQNVYDMNQVSVVLKVKYRELNKVWHRHKGPSNISRLQMQALYEHGVTCPVTMHEAYYYFNSPGLHFHMFSYRSWSGSILLLGVGWYHVNLVCIFATSILMPKMGDCCSLLEKISMFNSYVMTHFQ